MVWFRRFLDQSYFNKVKPFGNIVCFRDLEKATQEAIKTFGDTNSLNIILKKKFLANTWTVFVDQVTGIKVKGYTEVCQEKFWKDSLIHKKLKQNI